MSSLSWPVLLVISRRLFKPSCIWFSVATTTELSPPSRWLATRDRTNLPLLFPDQISNCTNLFRPKPNHTCRFVLAAVDHSRCTPNTCGSWNVASASVRRFWPQIRIPIPLSPHRLPAAAMSSPSEPGKLGHWRTINGCSCGAWSQGESDRTCPSALYYSICSLCSAGQLAECQAWVNDPHQSANFRGWAIRVSLRISRILADLRLQADVDDVHTSLPQTALAVGMVRRVARRHRDN